MVRVFTGMACSSSKTVCVLHVQLSASPPGARVTLPVTPAVPMLQLHAPVLLKGTRHMGSFLHHSPEWKTLVLSKPCCLEFDFISSHVLSRQTAKTNICTAGKRKVLTTLSKVGAWSFAPAWLSSYREAASFGSGVLFMQLPVKGQLALKAEGRTCSSPALPLKNPDSSAEVARLKVASFSYSCCFQTAGMSVCSEQPWAIVPGSDRREVLE